MRKDAHLRIARKIRHLRQSRKWTQAQLARELAVSQNWLSDIESGKGSLTAEQLIEVLKIFNVGIEYFDDASPSRESQFQKTLARLGATHLRENPDVLPSRELSDASTVIQEVLISATEPRLIVGIAPVVVNFAEPSFLNQLRLKFLQAGFIRRWGWLLENTLKATESEMEGVKRLPGDWGRIYDKARFVIRAFIDLPFFDSHAREAEVDDFLDSAISSAESVREIKRLSSPISKRWGIVTRIRVEDFVDALRQARETS